MAEKKTHQIAVHLSEVTRLRVRRFAEHEGMTESEYVHLLIQNDIAKKISTLRMLQSMLEVDGTISFEGSEKND